MVPWAHRCSQSEVGTPQHTQTPASSKNRTFSSRLRCLQLHLRSPDPLSPPPISSSISLTYLSCCLSSRTPPPPAPRKAGVERGWPGSSFQSLLHRPGTSKTGMYFAAVWLQCLAQALAHGWALWEFSELL